MDTRTQHEHNMKIKVHEFNVCTNKKKYHLIIHSIVRLKLPLMHNTQNPKSILSKRTKELIEIHVVPLELHYRSHSLYASNALRIPNTNEFYSVLLLIN